MCIGFFHVLFLEFGELQGICYTGKNGKGIFQSFANGAFDIVIGRLGVAMAVEYVAETGDDAA